MKLRIRKKERSIEDIQAELIERQERDIMEGKIIDDKINEPVAIPDILEEQSDKTDTTRWSKDAEFDIDKVEDHPELYIEINLIKHSRVVDTFFIFADKPKFNYKNKSYNIKEEGIYLLPKKRFFVPTSFYYGDKPEPVGFKQNNKGITGKALSLLYKNRLYETLLRTDTPNYNIFVILLLLAQMILFAVALYFTLTYSPEQVVNGGVPLQ